MSVWLNVILKYATMKDVRIPNDDAGASGHHGDVAHDPWFNTGGILHPFTLSSLSTFDVGDQFSLLSQNI